MYSKCLKKKQNIIVIQLILGVQVISVDTNPIPGLQALCSGYFLFDRILN